MTKRVEKQLNSFKYKGEPIKITFGTLVLTCFSVLLLIVATFTQLTLTHPYLPLDTFSFLAQDVSNYEIAEHFTKTYKYIPQIPIVLFIISLIGRKFGTVAILLYIVLGMFYPVFALGGGVSYLFEYGYGYILAYLPAIFFAGTFLKGKIDFLRLLIVAIIGVLVIHILGVLYMLFVATLRHASMDLVLSWIASQSGIQIFYDIFFSVVAIYLGRQVRKLLWIIMC